MKMLEMLKAVMDGGTGSRMRYKYKVECDMGARQVPPTVMPMLGLWVSRHLW